MDKPKRYYIPDSSWLPFFGNYPPSAASFILKNVLANIQARVLVISTFISWIRSDIQHVCIQHNLLLQS
jgi:hypothetical protein